MRCQVPARDTELHTHDHGQFDKNQLMTDKEKKRRQLKEAPYIVHNMDVKSVCEGVFYARGKSTQEICKNRDKCQKYAKWLNSKDKNANMVSFYYVDSFRNCDIYKHVFVDESFALQLAIYNMIYVNDLACACVIDMRDKIGKQDKETQKIYRALSKRQRRYDKAIEEIMGNDEIGHCAEFNLRMDEHIQPLVEDLYDQIYNYLHINNIENAQFIALAERAYIVLGYSVISINKRIKECLKYNKEVVNLHSYELTEMRDIAKNLCDWVSRKCKAVDLNKSPEIMESYQKLDKGLTDVNILGKAIIESR